MQKTCEPVETFVGSPPEEIADFVIDEASIHPDQQYPSTLELEATNTSPIYHHDAQRKKATDAVATLAPFIEKGIDSRLAEVALDCGGCALQNTCKIRFALDENIEKGDRAFRLLTEYTSDRQAREMALPYAERFSNWANNQARIKRYRENGNDDTSKERLVKSNNFIQSEFIAMLSAIGTPEDRDKAVDRVYEALPLNLQKKFVEEGFIDGVVAELFVFEQLKELQKNPINATVELSTSDEDIHDGYDIKVTLPSGKKIYFDAKSKLPSTAQAKTSYPKHFGQKYETTRDGKPVYALCPNPESPSSQNYMSTRRLKGSSRNISSFVPNGLEESQLSFIQLVIKSVNESNKR